ncbi:MAG TPA: outer membrane lipoprotein carrier protein LolA [Thermodesulfovibrionales bacterium]|nr:outer membrane lipoprotein carrier protein LolA [Thermodesulfovibrionales bacterium]
MSASFTQEKKTRLLAKPIRTSGKFLYKQPGSIRWEYTGSTNMQVIFNGKDLWIYYPDLKEADKLSGVAQYGAMMHFDISTMSRDYAITAVRERGLVRLRMTPKTRGPINLMEMELQEGAAFPRTVRLLDRNNEPTTITFNDIQLNPAIPDGSFNFLPGKDIVIRDRSLP